MKIIRFEQLPVAYSFGVSSELCSEDLQEFEEKRIVVFGASLSEPFLIISSRKKQIPNG